MYLPMLPLYTRINVQLSETPPNFVLTWLFGVWKTSYMGFDTKTTVKPNSTKPNMFSPMCIGGQGHIIIYWSHHSCT